MYTVITQYYFILLCNALKCPVRYLVLDIPFILLSDCWCVCGYATLVIIQLFSSVEFVHSRKQLSITFSMTWIVYLEFLLPFHVPWWNIHDCLWLFFSTGWQFTSEILPHFSRNWGTRYIRAKKIIKEWWWLSL